MFSQHQGICYSGYREGQNPNNGTFPTPEQITEDLRILSKGWRKLRIYDSGPHARLVLEAIAQGGFDFEVQLGAYIQAEVSNPDCPWGGVYSPEQLTANVVQNDEEVGRTIELATAYPSIVTSVSAGNEATVSWTDHLVPVERVIDVVRRFKQSISQPVTFCENHVPWLDKLAPLVPELDFISVHVYPVWEQKPIDDAIAATNADYRRVADRYPGKPVAITEAGWTTRSNGRTIAPPNASPELQARYYRELTAWSDAHSVLTYFFEAFDESWKGSDHPDEPEKHWGLFTVDRKPKDAMKPHFGSDAA